jgi:hypothetical protein
MTIEEGALLVGDTGDYLATVVVTNAAEVEVHREEIVITDPEDINARLKVLGDYLTGQYIQPTLDARASLDRDIQIQILFAIRKMVEMMAYQTEMDGLDDRAVSNGEVY